MVLDDELAYPVFKDNSFWFIETPDSSHKMIVIELDKRLAYSNWPKLLAADPDVLVESVQGQVAMTEAERQQAVQKLNHMQAK